MKWLISLIILTGSAYASTSQGDVLLYAEKTLNVLRNGRVIYTPGCEIAGSCFSIPNELKTSPNQNPLFSLCYQSGGTPYFAKLKSDGEKVPVCLKKEMKALDLESLMREYKAQRKRK